MCSLRYRKNRNLLNCDQVLFNVQNGGCHKFSFKAPEGSPVQDALDNMPADFKRILNEAAFATFASKYGIMTDVRRAMISEEERAAAEAEPFPKPSGPIHQLSDISMNKYFPNVVRYLCRRHGVKLAGRDSKLWATKKKNADGTETVFPATIAVTLWEDHIIDRNLFFGPGKTYVFGNKLHRQKMMLAHFMLDSGVDVLKDFHQQIQLTLKQKFAETQNKLKLLSWILLSPASLNCGAY